MSGRLLDAEGRPLSARDVEGTFDEWTADSINVCVAKVEDDGAGGFRIRLPARFDDSQKTLVLVSHAGPRGPGVKLDVSAARAGTRDLGTVRLAAPPLLGAGRVLGPDGQPVRLAQVHVERRWMGSRTAPATWNSFGGDASIDREGRFELRGWVGTDELRVVASGPWLAPSEREFRAGAQGIEVALARSGTIRGSLLLDPRCERGMIEVVALRHADGQELLGVVPESDGSFQMSELGPGTYDLRVRTSLLREPLATLEGVELQSGTDTLDPRLAAIDLRGKLLCVQVRVVTPPNVEPPFVQFEVRVPGREPGRSSAQESFAIATLAPAVDIVVEAPGWRIERLTIVTSDRVVALRPGIPVRLALQGGLPVLPAPFELRALLEPLEFELPRRGNRGVRFDADGTALVRAADPGPHRVRLEIRRLETGVDYPVPVEALTPSKLEIEESAPERRESLKVDAAILARAIAALEHER